MQQEILSTNSKLIINCKSFGFEIILKITNILGLSRRQSKQQQNSEKSDDDGLEYEELKDEAQTSKNKKRNAKLANLCYSKDADHQYVFLGKLIFFILGKC